MKLEIDSDLHPWLYQAQHIRTQHGDPTFMWELHPGAAGPSQKFPFFSTSLHHLTPWTNHASFFKLTHSQFSEVWDTLIFSLSFWLLLLIIYVLIALRGLSKCIHRHHFKWGHWDSWQSWNLNLGLRTLIPTVHLFYYSPISPIPSFVFPLLSDVDVDHHKLRNWLKQISNQDLTFCSWLPESSS